MSWYDPRTWGDESQSTKQKRDDLNETGLASNQFAEYAQGGVGAMTAESQQARDYLRQLASGQHSVAQEQLRQGLGQQLAQQQSFAASASPQNAAMAARNAANNMARASYGMSGQAAVAGLQERQQAQQALGNMIMQQRGQDMQGALGSRQNAISGYGGVTPEQSALEKYANPIAGGLGAAAQLGVKSDRRAKTEIKDGDDDANAALKGLRAYTYSYKDQRDGKGKQFGIMAQDLERAGLKHAVIDTPKGKFVDGAKAATASLGLVAALERRVAKIEGGK